MPINVCSSLKSASSYTFQRVKLPSVHPATSFSSHFLSLLSSLLPPSGLRSVFAHRRFSWRCFSRRLLFSCSRVRGWFTHLRSCHFMHPACSTLTCSPSSICPRPGLLTTLVLVYHLSIQQLLISRLCKHSPSCASCVFCVVLVVCCLTCVYVCVCVCRDSSLLETGCVTLFLLYAGNLLGLIFFAASCLFFGFSFVSFYPFLFHPKVTKNDIFFCVSTLKYNACASCAAKRWRKLLCWCLDLEPIHSKVKLQRY